MRSRPRDDHGATAVIVAMCLLLLFGAGAIAIDLGSGFETKRDLIVDTDSAALAAARVAAEGGCNVNTTGDPLHADPIEAAAAYLSENSGELVDPADLTTPDRYRCVQTPGLGTPNTLYVNLTGQAQQTLSPALGVEEIDVFASSTAEFNGAAIAGLRPFTACVADPAIAARIPPNTATTPVQYLMSMQKTFNEDGCATYPGGAGSWGYTCFDVSSACNDGLARDWIDGDGSGFQGVIDLGTAKDDGAPHAFNDDASDEDCDADGVAGDQICWAGTGSTCCNGVPDQNAINALVGKTFAMLVTDCIGEINTNGTGTRTDDTCVKGSGSNTNIHPYAFAYAQLDAWCTRKNNESSSTWSHDVGLTTTECFTTGVASGDLVLALTLLGVTTSGTPADFFNGEDPRTELCGVDSDTSAGLNGNRCDGTLSP